jgi:hypothetical protein
MIKIEASPPASRSILQHGCIRTLLSEVGTVLLPQDEFVEISLIHGYLNDSAEITEELGTETVYTQI